MPKLILIIDVENGMGACRDTAIDNYISASIDLLKQATNDVHVSIGSELLYNAYLVADLKGMFTPYQVVVRTKKFGDITATANKLKYRWFDITGKSLHTYYSDFLQTHTQSNQLT